MTELKPGRELDALIAEKVMGWKIEIHDSYARITDGEGARFTPLSVFRSNCECTMFRSDDCKCPPSTRIHWWQACGQLPHHSTDIAAAWEVVGKFQADHQEVHIRYDGPGDGWTCGIGYDPWDNFYIWRESGNTAPHAICLAALRAVGHLK